MPRIVRFHKVGGPEVLQIEEMDVPPPMDQQVQIRVKALGLNRAEALFRKGKYLEQPELPAKIGYEAAGIVEAVGYMRETQTSYSQYLQLYGKVRKALAKEEKAPKDYPFTASANTYNSMERR